MQKVVLGISSSLALVGIGFGVWATKLPAVDREIELVGGRTTVSFFPSILEANGLTLKTDSTAEGDPNTAEDSVGFAVSKGNLGVLLSDGVLVRFEDGVLAHRGGFRLSNGKRTIDARSFNVEPVSNTNQSLALSIRSGKETIPVFEASVPRSSFNFNDQTLALGQMDMYLSQQGADLLGRPDLAGTLVASLSIYAETTPADGGGKVTPPDDRNDGPRGPGAPVYDVAISDLSSLTVLGRTGTFPNGRNGLSMLTTSCNVGNEDIPWQAPMQVAHPVIAMNLYRVMNGRFEQVGWSWLKHGFFATNQGQCGTCDHPGTGSLLGPDCSDTYFTSNNGDRFYLGERKEVNPFTGVWNCNGSWFSNYVNDCVRRNNGSGLDSVAHRLEVADADLGNAGAQYFYEAYYINSNETVNVYNNVSSRQATFTWTGSSWSISTSGTPMVLGPAINRWGDQRSTATLANDGDVIVAVDVTDNGNGTWHYEYALYNHNANRAVREFSVPVPVGANVTNVGFRDIDSNGANQWTSSVAGGAVTWSTSTEGSSTANPLLYSSVFNFRFDADVQPATTTATLGVFRSGGAMSVGAPTMGPLVLASVQNYNHVMTQLLSGNLQSTVHSDNDRLMLRPGLLLSANSFFGIETTITAPNQTVNSIIVGVESQDASADGSGGQRKIELYNWTNDQWEMVDTRPTTNADGKYLVTISTNAGRFVNASTREVKARFLHRGGLTLSAMRPFGFDQLGFKFN